MPPVNADAPACAPWAAVPPVTHVGDYSDVARCPACAYLAGLRDDDARDDIADAGWRTAVRAVFVGRTSLNGRPLPSLIDILDARARTDTPGDREGDYLPGDRVDLDPDGAPDGWPERSWARSMP
jgi:hypothetical protein